MTGARPVLVGLAGGAVLFILWVASDAILLLFSGLLIAAFLDACTGALAKALPLRREILLALVVVAVSGVLAGLLAWSGLSVFRHLDEFTMTLSGQLRSLEQAARDAGILPKGATGETASVHRALQLLFPDPQHMFGDAGNALVTALGVAGEFAVAALVGIFVAIDPARYRRTLSELVPTRHRARLGEVLTTTAHYLRRWLIGQLIGMVLLGALTWIGFRLLGVPNALLLAILAGLLNFIPYLGAVAAAGPILLMVLPLGLTATVSTMALYTVIHFGVGYVAAPLIQERAVSVPPAVILASLVIFGVLFGLAGIAMATPLAVVIREAVVQYRVRSEPVPS